MLDTPIEGEKQPQGSDVEQVLNELEEEGHEIEGREPKADPPEGGDQVPKPKEGEEGYKKPDAKPPEGEGKKEPIDELDPPDGDKKPEEGGKKRRVKMIPAWKAEAEKNQIRSDHKKEIESLGNRGDKKPEEDNKVVPDEKKVQEFAKKYGASEEFMKDLTNIFGGNTLPPEIVKRLDRLDNLEQTIVAQADDANFSTEFNTKVLPTIKEEYPHLSDSQIGRIAKRVKDIAFTESYASTPLEVIYKGLDEFRGLSVAPKKTAEKGGRKGTGLPAQDDINFDSVTEDDIKNMDNATFDRFVLHQRKKK